MWLASIAATAMFAIANGNANASELHIYAWSGEIPQEVIDDFTAKTGTKVTVDTFDSNETLIAKLEGGAAGYDLIEPSQYAVQILAKKGLVEDIDHSKAPNISNLSDAFKSVSYDPGNKNSVPYIWGTTGFAYNTDCVKEPITSWKALWDEKYSGRVYMLDNMLAAYIAGLQVVGAHAGTTNPDEIAKATDALIKQKKILGGYNSTNFADLVASGEACIAEGWNGNFSQAAASNPKVVYVLPDEGGTMWVDGFSIVKGAANMEAAYAFINFISDPEVAAKAATLSKNATVIPAAKEKLPKEISGNSAIYPSDERLKKADFILDMGEAMKLYQDGWTKVKAAQ
jgi:spermidine/putrescine transport system substrate-binding protein